MSRLERTIGGGCRRIRGSSMRVETSSMRARRADDHTRSVVRKEGKRTWLHSMGGSSPLSTGTRGPATVLEAGALRRSLHICQNVTVSSEMEQCLHRTGTGSPPRRGTSISRELLGAKMCRPTRLLLTYADRPASIRGRSRRHLRLLTVLETFARCRGGRL